MNILQKMKLWATKDPAKFVPALCELVQKKSGYGEQMDALTGPERTFLLGQVWEMELNSGGFEAYFYNSYGDAAPETVAALRTIGADFAADWLEQAMAVFGAEYPLEEAARADFIDLHEDDGLLALWNQLDEAYYACYQEHQPDLNELNYAYVMQHKADFL